MVGAVRWRNQQKKGATAYGKQIGANAVVGFVVGVAGGLIGLGGAELRLPYLVGILGLTAHAAVPVNLAISLVTVLAALPVRLLKTDVGMVGDWLPVVLALIAGAVVTAYLGAAILHRVSSRALERAIATLLIVLGVVMITEALVKLVPAGLLPHITAVKAAAGVGFGLVIGAVSSLLGGAGGEVIIPTLVIGYGVPMTAAGTLSLIISLPTILIGLARHMRAGAFADRAVVRAVIMPTALGAVVGAPLGGALASYFPAEVIKAGLGALLIWSAWKVFGGWRAP